MGIQAVRELTGADEKPEPTPIFDELASSALGEQIKAVLAVDLSWVYAAWQPWVYDDSLIFELPPLTMGQAVHMIADRIQAISTPTSAWPLIEPGLPLAGMVIES